MVKASSPAASQLTRTPSIITANADRISPKASASPGLMRPAGIGIRVVPQVQRTGSTCTDRDRKHRDDGEERMDMDRRGDQPDESGEDDQRHHTRLEEREEVGSRRLRETKAGILHCVLFDQR